MSRSSSRADSTHRRLREGGRRLRQFSRPSIFSPSRALMLTGHYAMRAGIHNTIGGVSILHKNEKTIADLLGAKGYRTAVFGKWHLGYAYPSGRVVSIPTGEVAKIDTSPVSLMPPGLTSTLRRDELVDLMSYLTTLGK
ncbi:MAG: sulfatase-like hydrolase/transferase [Akkermansiaceae bacterium]